MAEIEVVKGGNMDAGAPYFDESDDDETARAYRSCIENWDKSYSQPPTLSPVPT